MGPGPSGAGRVCAGTDRGGWGEGDITGKAAVLQAAMILPSPSGLGWCQQLQLPCAAASSHLAAPMSNRFSAAPAPQPQPCGGPTAPPTAADPHRCPGPGEESPWLAAPALAQVARILEGYAQAFGEPLLAGLRADLSPRQRAQELFMASRVVLAHDGGDDPRLIYANRSALALWRHRWGEMVGLPSRLTAEPEHRADRARALAQARAQEALRGYGGIRVDRRGRRFRIEAARLWTLRDGDGVACGQAASFANWWWL